MIEQEEDAPALANEKRIELDSLLPEVLRTLKEGIVPDGLSPETTKFLEEILATFLEQVELKAKEMAKQGKKTVRRALLGENLKDNGTQDGSNRTIEDIQL